ncbi:hypothetical protein BC831DRAFT_501480 [Entophlyctis helioformis]|nr:hypothetical protein BC831DRAFT_501480 [Entophlyctis helioformis]
MSTAGASAVARATGAPGKGLGRIGSPVAVPTVEYDTTDYKDVVNRMLRPTEVCSQAIELVKVRAAGDRRLRIVAVIENSQGNQEACFMILKHRANNTLGVESIEPIFPDFRLALSQSKAVNLNDPGSMAQSKSGFILKVTLINEEHRFEASSVEILHGILVQVKAAMATAKSRGFSPSGGSHGWCKPYIDMMLDSQSKASPVHDMDPRHSASSRVTSIVSNPFINFESSLSVNTLKMVKDAWAAKELRKREQQFAEYSALKLFVSTWNVNNKAVTESLSPWLATAKDDEPDMYILGFQEVDLSTEAYIMGSSLKEEEWCKAVESALAESQTEKYIKVASKQLVGMLMIVYIRKSLYPFLHDVSTESVGTGILGMMGNKGAVGIRLKLFDSYLCFVNAHLAADTSMVERRNQDYQEICKRLVFQLQSHYRDYIAYAQANPWVASGIDSAAALNGFPVAGAAMNPTDAYAGSNMTLTRTMLSMFDADHLFWMGDLNYRVTLPDAEAKTMIEQGNLAELLRFDQLQIERSSSRSFNGFDEGAITFPPSYKYDVGTSRYDTSEKRRSPSWCDRVLWFSNPLKQQDPDWLKLTSYDSAMHLTMSDHKPVSARFIVKMRKLNGEKLMAAQDDITRELDKFENEAHPDLALDANQIQFGDIRYMTPATRVVMLENKGQVIAQYRFVPKLAEDRAFQPWCYVNPSTGALLPGEKLPINVTILVDRTTAPGLNSGKEYLEDILILHTENGKDHFLSVSAKWQPSSFGMPLNVLCRVVLPIRSYSLDDLRAIYESCGEATGEAAKTGGAGSNGESLDGQEIEGPTPHPPMPVENQLSLPKELWRLIDFIYKFGMDVDNLFLSAGDPSLCDYFRECIDTGVEFNLGILLSDPYDENMFASSTDYLNMNASSATMNVPPPLPPRPMLMQEDVSVNIDDLISSLDKTSLTAIHVRLPRPRGRAVAVHSAAETLMRFLEALPDPVVPSALHRRCVLEGYPTFAAGRQIIQSFPPQHYNAFIYITSFLREVLTNYRGRGELDKEKLAQVFSPIVLQTVAADFKSATLAYAQLPPGSTGGSTPASVTTSPPTAAAGPASPPKSTSSYLSSMFFGLPARPAVIGNTSAGNLSSGSASAGPGSGQAASTSPLQTQLQQPQPRHVSAGMIGPPIPADALALAASRTSMAKTEFSLFPHKLWRPVAPYLEGDLPKDMKDPWARREAWRYHPFFSLRNRMRNLVPGLGLGVASFGLYVLYDQWYYSKGPGAAETAHWAKFMEERRKRMGHDEHGHGHH